MKAPDKFKGFSNETFQFFRDLELNNCKPWFDEHKKIYEQEVLQPLRSLVVAMTPAMHSIDSQMDFRPTKIVSRIYRDVRFSHDKSPYKTHMWVTFQRMTPQWESYPGFFMEIGGNSYQYGMGLFAPKKKVMDAFRSKVEYEQDQFKKITQDLATKHGFTLGGEEYKRPLSNELPAYFQNWIQRKSIYLLKQCPLGKELFDEGFAQHMANEFTLTQPLYEFLLDASEDAIE